MVQADCTHLITLPERSDSDKGDLPLPTGVRVLTIDRQLETILRSHARPHTNTPSQTGGQDAIQAIVFTSGTTGRPKGAMLTYANHFYNAVGSAFRLGILPSDQWLVCMPLYHVGGMAIILRACLYGIAVILHDGFSPERVSSDLERLPISIVSLVPTMLFRLLPISQPERWKSLRFVLLGGGAATAELLQAAHQVGIPVATTYGLTEAASQVATMPPTQALGKPGSVGKPLLFTQVRITDESGTRLEQGEIGEIRVHGPGVFDGYYGNEQATERALPSGELRTGDLGYLDSDGDLWVVQRRSDLIVSGGENVYPAEVEQVLMQHPAVSAVCVVGLSDPEWGQRVAGLVVAEEVGSADDLIAFARLHLAAYKVPRTLVLADELPLTGSGKISRTAVADILRQATGTPA
ncbi:MAG: o-succinylbenzoate--CoA ligase [Chloroflexota bacterium]